MKRLSLWLTVGLVLFSVLGGFARPTKAQLDSLEALQPALDSTANVIAYDSLERFGPVTEDTVTNEDYWIAVRFTPEFTAFTLQVVYFQVLNSLINSIDGCSIIVMNDSLQRPDTILLVDTVPKPLANRLRSLTLKDSLEFGKNVSFWILLGPVPGGFDTDNIGDGWWALGADADRPPSDSSSNTARRSYFRLDNQFSDDAGWIQYRQANWVLRAGGKYSDPPDVVINEVMFNADVSSSDPARNHEWVELYNKGDNQTTTGWKLLDEKSDQMIITGSGGVPVGFPGGYYLVVHFGVPPGHLNGDCDTSGNRIDLYKANTGGFFDDRKGSCVLNVGLAQHLSYMGWNLKNLSIDSDSLVGSLSGFRETEFGGLAKAAPLRAKRIQPTEGVGPLLTATAGISIGLDSQSDITPDLNISLEKDPPFLKAVTFLGGPDAAGPTMGRQNLLPMVFDVSSQLPLPGVTAPWTIMLYMAADYGDDQRSPDRWYYDILNQIERVDSGWVDSVNVVVLCDTRRAQLSTGSGTVNGTFEGSLQWDTTDVVRNLKFISSDANTGRDTTLAGFISRAKSSYPARHFALVIKGDGAGWQGVCGDADSDDRLEMGELKSALDIGLDGDTLDLLIFDAPLMSQLEVAAQVKDYSHLMVASPEMIGPADFDYPRLVKDFRGGTDPSTLVNSLKTILGNRNGADPFAVWTIINLDNLDMLTRNMDTLANNLKTGVEDRCIPGASSENYQINIRRALTDQKTDHYGTQAQGMADFIDLRRFAINMQNPNYDNNCTSGHKKGADSVAYFLKINGSVIDGLEGGGIVPLVGMHRFLSFDNTVNVGGGLSIYFPSARQRVTPLFRKAFSVGILAIYEDSSDHPFDRTGLEMEGGAAESLRIYALDTSTCYPHAVGPCLAGVAPKQPYPPVADFNFVQDHRWDEFLIRYYKPVADAGLSVIDKKLNEKFSLNGSGTSDADDDPSSLSYFWDLYPTENSSTSCADYRLDDLDKDCINTNIDDADSSNQTISFSYSESGNHFIWLHVWDPTDNSLADPLRRFQTSKDSVKVQIQFRGIQFVWEDDSITDAYTAAFPPVGYEPLDATDVNTRNDMTEDTLTHFVNLPNLNKPHVVWATGSAAPPLFPGPCQKAINKALTHDDMGILVFGPGVAGDPEAKQYFDSLGFAVDSAPAQLANFIVPDATYPQHFLFELGSLALSPGTALRSLVKANLDPFVFPILKTDAGKIVAAAKVTDSGRHAIVYFAFDLGKLVNTSDKALLLRKSLGWLASPYPPLHTCTLSRPKGSFTCDSMVSVPDVVLALNCAYLGTGDCDTSFGDVTCDGRITGADAVQLLNMVFLGDSLGDNCYPSVFRTGVINDELDNSAPLGSSIGSESEYEGIFRRKRR